MRLISLRNRIRSGCLTVLATATVVALAAPGSAQTVPPTPAGAAPSADLAKVHLTAARNALSDVTQLPAAAQLSGETRTRVQQLITSFNELIGKSDWRGPYAKVEANLSTLLGSETPAPATVAPGAVGTSGAAAGLDPAIRAKLVEFRTHLDMFKTVASAAAPADSCAAPAAHSASAATAPPAALRRHRSPRHQHQRRHPQRRRHLRRRPRRCRPRLQRPQQHPRRHRRQHLRPRQTRDRTRRHRQSPSTMMGRTIAGVARDLLLHVEALEVILGAQARVQREATAAAGGAVVSSETPSGSTRTTVTGPDVTLNGQQLEQIKTHLAEMRRLLEKK